MINPPETNVFRVDYDRKNKNSQISPGLFLEILISFDCELLKDWEDKITISSENGFRRELRLKAHVPQALVHFEPLINLGFVPVNTKKTETIEFVNDGLVDSKIQLNYDHSMIALEPDKFDLLKNSKENRNTRKKLVTVTFE